MREPFKPSLTVTKFQIYEGRALFFGAYAYFGLWILAIVIATGLLGHRLCLALNIVLPDVVEIVILLTAIAAGIWLWVARNRSVGLVVTVIADDDFYNRLRAPIYSLARKLRWHEIDYFEIVKMHQAGYGATYVLRARGVSDSFDFALMQTSPWQSGLEYLQRFAHAVESAHGKDVILRIEK